MRLFGSLLTAVIILFPNLIQTVYKPDKPAVLQTNRGGFLENRGQFAEPVLFSAAYPGGIAWITEDSIWYSLADGSNIRLEFGEAAGMHAIERLDRLPIRTSYYLGTDPMDWIVDIPTYGSLIFRNVQPGFDLEFSMEGDIPFTRILDRRAEVIPDKTPFHIELTGARPQPGASPVWTVADGSPAVVPVLDLTVETGRISIPLPVGDDGWILEIEDTSSEIVETTIPASPHPSEAVNSSRALVPLQTSVQYSSYLGSLLWDQADGVGYDAEGRLYLAGYTYALDFPNKPGSVGQSHNVDAIAARLDPDTGGAGYLAVFRGGDLLNGHEFATDIAVDDQGNTYLAGYTNSADFPTTPGAFDTTPGGGFDAFALKMDPVGSLIYSTLLGGDGLDQANALSLKTDGSILVAGGTISTDFPTTPDALYPSSAGSRDVFVSELNPFGSDLIYSTYYGGAVQDQAEDIGLGTDGSVYLTGWTSSADFPTTPGAFDLESNGSFDAFLLRMTADSQPPLFSTYLGGFGEDRGYGIKILPGGEAAAVGRTNSADFPVAPYASQPVLSGGDCPPDPCPDAFYAILTPAGDSLVDSSYLGGVGWDAAFDVAAGSQAELDLIGETYASDFPVSPNAADPSLDGGRDAFLARYNPVVRSLTYASYLGGSDWDEGFAVTVDPANRLFAAGRTNSTDFPTTPNAYSESLTGDYDAFGMILELPGDEMIFLPILAKGM